MSHIHSRLKGRSRHKDIVRCAMVAPVAAAAAVMRRSMRKGRVEAGVDEAGRGCLAGPVAAAAVVWDPALEHPLVERIRDSKRLSPRMRETLREFIEAHAVAWAVRLVDAPQIDRENILQATQTAMHGALDELDADVDSLLVDGNHFRPYISQRTGTGEFVPHTCVVRGDDQLLPIAAASILAKTHRDRYVRTVMHPQFPQYGWDRNMGYGSAEHMARLRELGPTPFHRQSFAPVRVASQIRADAEREPIVEETQPASGCIKFERGCQ